MGASSRVVWRSSSSMAATYRRAPGCAWHLGRMSSPLHSLVMLSRWARHGRVGALAWDDLAMQIAVLLFPQVTALDAIGPYEVLQRLPGFELTFVATARGEYRTDNGRLGLMADASLDEVLQPAVIVVPGGVGTRALVGDETISAWLRH